MEIVKRTQIQCRRLDIKVPGHGSCQEDCSGLLQVPVDGKWELGRAFFSFNSTFLKSNFHSFIPKCFHDCLSVPMSALFHSTHWLVCMQANRPALTEPYDALSSFLASEYWYNITRVKRAWKPDGHAFEGEPCKLLGSILNAVVYRVFLRWGCIGCITLNHCASFQKYNDNNNYCCLIINDPQTQVNISVSIFSLQGQCSGSGQQYFIKSFEALMKFLFTWLPTQK